MSNPNSRSRLIGRRKDPGDPSKIVLAWEVDAQFQATRSGFIELLPPELETVLRNRGIITTQTIKIGGYYKDRCYNLTRPEYGKPALIRDIRHARTELAKLIGVTPAAFNRFLPEYDSEYLKTYRYSLISCCRAGGRACIRPSHLRLCRYEGLPTYHPLDPEWVEGT